MLPLVKLYAVRNNENNPGYVSSCIACGARGRRLGRRFREPMRLVRATNVSDVHVLAQDMIHHAQRKRLLLFADNRQDAAFQAGWMKDHSRRFRLRSLMAETMQDGPVSVSDMVMRLDDMLDRDDTLSRVLIPEVWRVIPQGRARADRMRMNDGISCGFRFSANSPWRPTNNWAWNRGGESRWNTWVWRLARNSSSSGPASSNCPRTI